MYIITKELLNAVSKNGKRLGLVNDLKDPTLHVIVDMLLSAVANIDRSGVLYYYMKDYVLPLRESNSKEYYERLFDQATLDLKI